MANCAHAKGANRNGTQNCAKFVFLSYDQNEICPLYFLKYVDVFYSYVHASREFNDEIMKIAQGRLNKKFRMKKSSMNSLVLEREKQMFKV
jgi:hypothetical protein